MVSYRPNVAALMTNLEGNLLICERTTIPGSWQFPQGGIDSGESALDALHREVSEEIGLSPSHYEVLSHRSGYRYLYPEKVRLAKLKKHGNHGQEQTYFHCLLNPNAPPINVSQSPPEFSAYRWISPDEFDLDWLPSFKRETYAAVLSDFFGMITEPPHSQKL